MNIIEKIENYLINSPRKKRKEYFIIKEDFWGDLECEMDNLNIPKDWEMCRRLNHFKTGTAVVPKCDVCGINDKKWHPYKNDYGFCSQSCSSIFVMKQRCDKLGVINIFQLDEIKEKSKKTILKKYGVDNISKLDSIKRQKENTMLKNYNRKDNFNSNLLFKKYGVNNPAHIPEVFEKIQYNRFKKRKKIITPLGKIIYLQGNEPEGYQTLLNEGFGENEILHMKKDMPKITYNYKNKVRRYYPDFYIKKNNIIIEIKSNYTYNVELEKNLLKKEATIKLGFEYRFMIFN
jgi:hypothetical protein